MLMDLLDGELPPFIEEAPLLKVTHLTKRYGRFRAVDDVSFEVRPGAIFGFVGPNGAGKTTTIKMLATLLEPTAGQVLVGGYDVIRQAAQVRDLIGYVPDFFGVYDDLTVLEYLDFYARSQGVNSLKRSRLLGDLLELVELGPKRDAYVETLSRGMKQRLCLARCLVHDPQVLLLDEPASGLDPRARVEMRELLKELQRMGKTIVVSSHILPELAELCTDLGIVDRGRFLAGGTVAQITRQYGRRHLLRVRLLDESQATDPSGLARLMEQTAALLGASPGLTPDTTPTINLARAEVLAEWGGSESQLRLVLAALTGAGLPVIGFGLESSNLEDIFMSITESRAEA